MKNEEIDNERLAWCPCCEIKTEQILTSYDPDVDETQDVWECTVCRELVDFA